MTDSSYEQWVGGEVLHDLNVYNVRHVPEIAYADLYVKENGFVCAFDGNF